ncbi:DUF2029 domain-containing protein [Muriicola sp. Z0-33]|uniref:DUF2029 domain-containing protein n=1 Tax=Muriicola sp. Z0-33 TaxID=2816957 RepID=UPI00223800C1|nr:DUF2029 domain-containing protein [Muriicola sp. Z0-33]MCW5514873.1 DUF2029 domain-containing protein [Muriicola sp. Z0-33]
MAIFNKTNLEKYKWLWYAIFAALLLLNLVYAYYRLMYLNAGGDAQWYGAKLLWEGTNPYMAALTTSDWFLTAYPNYAHILYYILFPLTYFDWEQSKIVWFMFNVGCFIYTLYAFVRWEKIKVYKVLLIASLMLIGSNFANTLYQGQISIFILCCVSLAWVFRKKSWFLLLMLSLVFSKYSLGLPILLGFFLAGYYKEAIGAFAINLLFALLFAFQFDIGFLESLALPFEVATMYTSGHGHSDLLTLFRLTHSNTSFLGINFFSIGAVLVYGAFSIYCFIYKPDKRLIIISALLLCFPILFHLQYDYVVLLAPLLIAFSHPGISKRNRTIVLSLAAYFWIYPIVPKLLRSLLNIDIGIHPIDHFGPVFGLVFIALNMMLFIISAFVIVKSRSTGLTNSDLNQ